MKSQYYYDVNKAVMQLKVSTMFIVRYCFKWQLVYWRQQTAIDKTSSAFQGHDQRDAQEFLTFLLDQLHEDDNEIKDKPYVVMQVERGDYSEEQVS